MSLLATDTSGSVHWSQLARGPHEFCVVTGLFGAEEGPEAVWETLAILPSSEARLELVAGPRANLQGSVFSAGRPLQGTRVLLRPTRGRPEARGGPSLTTRTSSAGRFAFEGLPLGTYHLEFQHPNRAGSEQRELRLDLSGADLRVDFSDAELTGRVLDAEGEPVGGATVRLWTSSADSRSSGRAEPPPGIQSDASGRFTLVGLDPASAVRLEVEAEGHATLQTEPRALGGPWELRLEPEAPLELELLGAGRPFFVLTATGPRGEQRRFTLGTGSRVALHGLAAGRWRLRLQAPNRGRRGAPVLDERSVDLEVGRTTQLTWALP